MKKVNLFAVCTLAVCATALVACNDDPTPKTTKVITISTGVLNSENGEEIIIADRNVGATAVEGYGSYLTWSQAQTACPNGYHSMTGDEYNDLANEASDVEELIELLKAPLAGYYDADDLTTLVKGGLRAYIWASYDSDEDDAASAARLDPTDAMGFWYYSYDSYSKADKMSVRCVQDYPEPTDN